MQNHARTDIRCLITGCSVVYPSLLLQDIDKPLDIEFMKRLHVKVNIIPLIVKADTLTPEECQQFKKQSLQYCLGTSGNSKPRPHMKKTGKGFVTMENTCRVKALFHANKGKKKKLLNTQKAEKRPLSLHLQKPSKSVGLRMHPFFYSLSKCCNGYHLSGGHKPSLKSI
nr:uncharacterized protein LOC129483175 isoform X5 [Symphalangus syndactylus]